MGRIIGIAQYEAEFVKIAKGRIRRELIKYALGSQFRLGRTGKPVVVIPIEQIELPTIRYGFRDEQMRIGQGEGKPGDDLGPVPPEEGEGEGKGASGEGGPGEPVEIEIDEEEYFSWIEDELKLQRLLPKGDRTIVEEREKYTSIHHLGPRSAIHKPRTMQQAIRRSIATGDYRPPERPAVSVMPPDFRFVSTEKVKTTLNNAVLFFARDYSGSVGDEENVALSKICDLTERWVRKSYPNGAFEVVYIVHGVEAYEVKRPQFFGSQNMGGTLCSTALKKILEIIGKRYPVEKWNIYPFYFSDGFNWSEDDEPFVDALKELLEIANLFCYGQTHLDRPWLDETDDSDLLSPPGTIGALIDGLKEAENPPNLVHAEVAGADDESVMGTIREFFKEQH